MKRFDGIGFTEEAIKYLRNRKTGAGETPYEQLCWQQIHRVRKQANLLQNYLEAERVLDIGCGLALIDIYLAREFGAKQIYLMDGDGSGEFHKEYKEESKPWNDVGMAYRMLRFNVKPTIYVTTVCASPNVRIPKMDLIISLKSWGLHYPAETYIALAKDCLRKGGFLILDLHKPDEGKATLEGNGFRLVHEFGKDEATSKAVLSFKRCVFRCE